MARKKASESEVQPEQPEGAQPDAAADIGDQPDPVAEFLASVPETLAPEELAEIVAAGEEVFGPAEQAAGAPSVVVPPDAPAPPPVDEAAADDPTPSDVVVIRYARVLRAARWVSADGAVQTLAEGSIVSELTHDVRELARQGVPLAECSAPVVPPVD